MVGAVDGQVLDVHGDDDVFLEELQHNVVTDHRNVIDDLRDETRHVPGVRIFIEGNFLFKFWLRRLRRR